MENHLRNYWKSCLLGLLLFLAACKGNPLPSQDGTSWQHCKDASEKLIKMLQNYGIKMPAEATLSVSFPQRIECSDKCDPDSLNEDKTHCLQKITRGLHGYHDLLRLFSKSDSTADLQSVLQELLQLLPENGSVKGSSSEADYGRAHEWEHSLVLNHTLWRLQSFSIVVARVLAYSAASTGKGYL